MYLGNRQKLLMAKISWSTVEHVMPSEIIKDLQIMVYHASTWATRCNVPRSQDQTLLWSTLCHYGNSYSKLLFMLFTYMYKAHTHSQCLNCLVVEPHNNPGEHRKDPSIRLNACTEQDTLHVFLHQTYLQLMLFGRVVVELTRLQLTL